MSKSEARLTGFQNVRRGLPVPHGHRIGHAKEPARIGTLSSPPSPPFTLLARGRAGTSALTDVNLDIRIFAARRPRRRGHVVEICSSRIAKMIDQGQRDVAAWLHVCVRDDAMPHHAEFCHAHRRASLRSLAMSDEREGEGERTRKEWTRPRGSRGRISYSRDATFAT